LIFDRAACDRRVLVEVPMQDWSERAAEAQLKLLAEQREIDQLQQRRLELTANLGARMRTEGWQMRDFRSCRHISPQDVVAESPLWFLLDFCLP
jgi:hypothetical protein